MDIPDPKLSELTGQGYTPLEYVVSVKALDPSGEVVLIFRKSRDLTPWEAVGMLVSAQDDLRDSMRIGTCECGDNG